MEIDKQVVELNEIILEKVTHSNIPQYKSSLRAEDITITTPKFTIDSVGNIDDDFNIFVEVQCIIKNYLMRKAVLDKYYGKLTNYTDYLGERESWIFSSCVEK